MTLKGLLLCLFVLFSSCTGVPAITSKEGNLPQTSKNKDIRVDQDRILNEYLLSSKTLLSDSEVRGLFTRFPIQTIEEVRTRPPLYRIVFENEPGLGNLKKIVEKNENLNYVEPNFIYLKS